MDIIFAGGKFRAKSKFANIAKISSTRKIGVIQYSLVGSECSEIHEHSVERGSSVVECRTRNRVSPGSNPPLVPFGRLGIFLLSIDAPVDSAV